jgi:hypothetical protein
VALKHTWEIPVAPSVVRPELNLPDAVDRVVLKALAKQPVERHKSVELLARELKAAVKTSQEIEVLTTQTVVLNPTQNQEPEPRAQIASKIAKPAYARVLPGILLLGAGLLTLLLYFKPWGRNPGPVTGAGAGIPVNSPVASIPISKMKVSLIRQDKRGNEEGVSPETTFYSGDSVRIRIQADQNGFLYIVSRGSSGKVSMLYPDRRIRGGDNQLVKGKVVSIPTDGGWITFDKKPGTETLYLLFAENRTEKFIGEIENATSQNKISLPTELEGQAVDLVTTGGDLKGQGTLIGALKLRHQP